MSLVALTAASAAAQTTAPPRPITIPVAPLPREQRVPDNTPPIITTTPPRPDQAPPRATLITNPSWIRQPMPEYPDLAHANGVTEGRVTLNCLVGQNGALSDCRVIRETPVGHDFAASAMAATGRARLSPRTVDRGIVGARVTFDLRYVSPPEEPTVLMPAPAVSTPPPTVVRTTLQWWTVSPPLQFPDRALARGVYEGRAVLQCRVGAAGVPQQCLVVEESPAGLGFGRAALDAMPGGRLAARFSQGATVRVPINFLSIEPALPPVIAPTPRR